MAHYKLTYFNLKGRAEVSRLILAAAGVEYEDNRVEGDAWTQFKPNTPFGSLPVLCIDGKTTLAESMAIARYLARAHGLAGKDALEQAQADMIIDSHVDALVAMYMVVFQKDEQKKEELRAKFRGEQLPKFLSGAEKILGNNNGGKGYIVGDALTYADLAIYNFLSIINSKHPSALEPAPMLKGLMERVGALPKIKCWVEKRPQTDM